jgi:hypothetical protein
LNYNGYNRLGEPKVLIPQSTTWQSPLPQLPQVQVRFPANDYKIRFLELLNFILGADGLKQVPVEIKVGALVIPFNLDLPALGPILQGFGTSGRIDSLPRVDFTQIPDIRYYVVGASNDSGTVSYAGNYWMADDVSAKKY